MLIVGNKLILLPAYPTTDKPYFNISLPTCSDGKKTLDRPAQTNASKGINTKANTSTLSYQVCSLLFSTTVGNSFLMSSKYLNFGWLTVSPLTLSGSKCNTQIN